MYLVMGDSSMTFDGRTPEHQPLGGSQSAMVYMSEALVRRGFKVQIYNRCPDPITWKGVDYRSWHTMNEDSKSLNPDFFICIRDPKIQFFWRGGGKRILWCQDWYDQPVLQGLTGDISDIFFVGRWQMEGFCEKTTWPVSRAWVVPNGIVPEYYRTDDHVFREGKRLIYTSTPFRGLMHLSYLFPEIQRRVPDAELHICGGMAVYQDHNSEYDRTYEAFTGMDGVTLHGSLGQRALATEMEKCRVLAYPNTFPETCCTTAYEAMAAGLVIVTSDRAGLTDTVGSNGVLIEGEPGTEQYTTAFVDACVHYLEEDNQWGLEARKAWAWAHNNRTWDVLAQTWIDNLELIQQKG